MISTWIGIGVFLSVSAANVAATKGKEDVPAPVAASEEAKPAEKVKAEPEAKKVEVKKEVSKPTIQLGAQVRPRVEKAFTGNLGVPTAPNSLAGKPNMAVSQRSRIHATIKGDGVSGKVSIQDVRGWGSEASTLKDFTGDAIDFHEAYLEFGDATKLKIGRQEIIWDDHRLIGSVNWTQQARSFDAIRLTHKQKGNFGLEAFASRLQDGQPHDLIGLHGCKHLGGVRIAVPLIFQTNLMLSDNLRGADRTDWTRFTGGIDISAGGKDKKLSWRLSAYSQNGGTEDQSISAMLVAANVGYKVSNILQPMLWVDYVSGDTDHTDDVNGSFDTLFATNHKFYGFQDRFLNVPL
ncbi:alginate export family protein, partial [Myxococcota bacterium]|nr:alginate export family protein [Myxococcota bacterium]